MDTRMILQKYLLFTSISEYRGSTSSLVEMIYWAMGEVVSVQGVEMVIAANKHIGKHCLTFFQENDTILSKNLTKIIEIKAVLVANETGNI